MSAHSRGPNPHTQTAALAKARPSFSGTYRSASRVSDMLARAATECHLVSPMRSCGKLPDGCEVALSVVYLDVEHETYPVTGDGNAPGGGQLGLSKTALERIAAAAGVSWDVRASGRVDDGSDPRYCLFRAVGYVRDFDGVPREIGDHKELDLREGSDEIESLWARYREKVANWKRGGSRGYEPRSPEAQIRELRRHIVSHAETKARNRAIRSIGVRTSYAPHELERPFAVAKLVFTGASNDPGLRAMFAAKRADALLGGMMGLYGEAKAPAGVSKVAPPPVGKHAVEEDEDDGVEIEHIDPETGEVTRTRAPAPPLVAPAPRPAASRARRAPPPPANPPPARAETASPAPPAAPPPPPAPTASVDAPRLSGLTIPGGREKGVPIENASDEALAYWANRIANNVADRTSYQPARDEAWVRAANAETERRLRATAEDEIPF